MDPFGRNCQLVAGLRVGGEEPAWGELETDQQTRVVRASRRCTR